MTKLEVSRFWKVYEELYNGLSRSELNKANPKLYKKLRESGELARIPYVLRRIEEITEPILAKYENEVSPKSGRRYCDLSCKELKKENPEFFKELMIYIYKDKPNVKERSEKKSKRKNKKKLTEIVLLDDMFDTDEDEKRKALKERIKQKIKSQYPE